MRVITGNRTSPRPRRERWLLALVLGTSACASIARVAHYERPGSFAMPDVAGKTADDARTELAAQGIAGTVEVRNEICRDFPQLPEDRVCYTAPRAGTMTSARIPITLYIKDKAIASFEMPSLVGLTADEAKRKLAALGQNPDRVLIETVPGAPPDDCIADRVCTQSPAAGQTAWVTGPKLLGVGPPGWKRKPTPPEPPPRPPQTQPPRPDAPAPVF